MGTTAQRHPDIDSQRSSSFAWAIARASTSTLCRRLEGREIASRTTRRQVSDGSRSARVGQAELRRREAELGQRCPELVAGRGGEPRRQAPGHSFGEAI